MASLVALGAGIAALTGIGAGIGIGIARHRHFRLRCCPAHHPVPGLITEA